MRAELRNLLRVEGKSRAGQKWAKGSIFGLVMLKLIVELNGLCMVLAESIVGPLALGSLSELLEGAPMRETLFVLQLESGPRQQLLLSCRVLDWGECSRIHAHEQCREMGALAGPGLVS